MSSRAVFDAFDPGDLDWPAAEDLDLFEINRFEFMGFVVCDRSAELSARLSERSDERPEDRVWAETARRLRGNSNG